MAHGGFTHRSKHKIGICKCEGSIDGIGKPCCSDSFTKREEMLALSSDPRSDIGNYKEALKIHKEYVKKEQKYWVFKIGFNLHLLIGKSNLMPKLKAKQIK
jgi:hypothetical protein